MQLNNSTHCLVTATAAVTARDGGDALATLVHTGDALPARVSGARAALARMPRAARCRVVVLALVTPPPLAPSVKPSIVAIPDSRRKRLAQRQQFCVAKTLGLTLQTGRRQLINLVANLLDA